MGSRWRFNIADLGLTGLHMTLCARLLPDDPFTHYFLVNYFTTRPGQYEIWRYNPVLNGGLPELYLGPIFLPGSRFPAVWDVEPDVM